MSDVVVPLFAGTERRLRADDEGVRTLIGLVTELARHDRPRAFAYASALYVANLLTQAEHELLYEKIVRQGMDEAGLDRVRSLLRRMPTPLRPQPSKAWGGDDSPAA